MKEIKISAGGLSGQVFLIFGLFAIVIAVHSLSEGVERGSFLPYIGSIIQLCLASHFFFHWYQYWSGSNTMAFHSDDFEIRKNGIATYSGKFMDLSQITQDGRGYTITIPSGTNYRLLRKAMDAELQSALDTVQQQQAEQGGDGDAEEAV